MFVPNAQLGGADTKRESSFKEQLEQTEPGSLTHSLRHAVYFWYVNEGLGSPAKFEIQA